MDVKCTVDNLGEVIGKELKEYEAEVTAKIRKQVSKTAKELKEDIQKDSPVNTKMPGPKYKDSWKTKVTRDDLYGKEETVYSDQPGLTHLLEHGHALRQGGRATAKPHIGHNAEAAKERFEKQCAEELEHGY